MMTLPTFAFVLALTFSLNLGQPDPIRTPGAKGSSLVESVLRILKEACLYSDDTNFLRRLANVESSDGLDYDTFRMGYDGGIWQIDQDKFDLTLKESARLASEYRILKEKLGIDWNKATWSDLLKPLYSGIAAALYVKVKQSSSFVPDDIQGQASYWQTNLRPGKTANQFVDDVQQFEKSCESSSNLDLVYLVDTSVSVTDQQMADVKSHIKDHISSLATDNGLGSDGDRVAMITFSTRAILAFPLERSVDPQSLMASVDLAPRAGGSTNTSDAFTMAKTQVLSTARPDANQVVVLVIDGKSDNPTRALDASILLKSQGVQIVVVGIGGGVDSQELDSLASVPVCQNSMRLRTYSDLPRLHLKFRQRVCTEPKQLSPGEYTFPCSQNLLARLPSDGKAYTLNMKVTDGEADILASYQTPNPTSRDNDFSHRLVTSHPVILKVNDTKSLAVKIMTNKPGQGQVGPRSCTGNYTVIIDNDVMRMQQCNSHYLDLLLLVDEAILRDYQQAQRLANISSQFVDQFDVAQDKHRVGVATFDTSVHNALWLSESTSVPKVLTSLKTLLTTVTTSGHSDLAVALKWAREVGMSGQHGARSTSSRTVLVVTPGAPLNGIDVQMQGKLLQSEGIRVAVVALGPIFDDATLSSIASSPLRVIKANDVASLPSSLEALTNATCGAVKVKCVENGVDRECSPEDLINSQYSPIVVGDRNLTTNPCALPPVPGLPPITRFPHPSRKDRFLICDSKRQAYVVLCPIGELYNAQDKECEAGPPTTTTTTSSTTTTRASPTGTRGTQAPTSATTKSTVSTTPTTQAPPPSTTTYLQSVCTYNNIVSNSRLHEFPSDRNKYVNCSLAAGQGQIMTCPQGRWWVQASLACRFVCPIIDPGQGTVDCSVPNPCNGALVYYSHQRDATKFIQCNSAKEAFVLSCPVGQIWKPRLAACDIP